MNNFIQIIKFILYSIDIQVIITFLEYFRQLDQQISVKSSCFLPLDESQIQVKFSLSFKTFSDLSI